MTAKRPLHLLRRAAASASTFASVCLLTLAGIAPASGAPVITRVQPSDVSPCGVRIVWQTDIASEPTLQVYSDAAGTIPVTTAITQAYAGCDDLQKILLADSGLMAVDVTGLAANTLYYFRPRARSLADSTLTAAPLVSIRTATASGATALAAPFTALVNPVVRFACLSPSGEEPAEIGILLARVAGARSPVTRIVSDGGMAYLDMANLISTTTGVTLPVAGGESLVLELYRGRGTVETHQFYMPASDGLGTVQDPRLIPGPVTTPQVRAVQATGPGTTGGPARIFMEFPAALGGIYQVEASSSLTSGTWTVVETGLRPLEPRLFWEDHGLSNSPVPPSQTPRRFYRLSPAQ